MKIFLSAIENSTSSKTSNGTIDMARMIVANGIKMKYNLMSYYYIKGAKIPLAEFIRDNSEEILIDSGAHSFQKGKKVDWVEYTKEYAEFIKKFDRPNVVGYFEMDVDNIIGYEKVKELRRMLEQVSDKIIPVWHKNRGLDDFKQMCKDYAGKVVAITGFKNEDIKDDQYIMFLKYAKKFGCKVHCLGMTRKKILEKVPFDYTDSSSWVQSSVYGRIANKGKVSREMSKNRRELVFLENYKEGIKMQEHFYNKWRKVSND
jgi:hypothetical protein